MSANLRAAPIPQTVSAELANPSKTSPSADIAFGEAAAKPGREVFGQALYQLFSISGALQTSLFVFDDLCPTPQ